MIAGDLDKLVKVNGPVPLGIVVIPFNSKSKAQPEELETECFWCELSIVLFIKNSVAKAIPVCCARCKNYFWF